MQRLPSLRALRAFEAAGRHQSFTRASEELNVSQGAVSHQISILEQELGFPLFNRAGGGVVLTEKGEALLSVLERAFGDISARINELTTTADDLRIKVPPAFMARWLLPRLQRFQAVLPQVRLRITTSLDPIDFRNAPYDAAVAELSTPPPGVQSLFLMKELLTPVCSTEFLRDHGPFQHPRDLIAHPVITVKITEEAIGPNPYWRRWLAAMGESECEPVTSQEYDTLDAALHAARQGFGCAMADYYLIQDELRSGQLIMPFNSVIDHGVGYYLLVPKTNASTPGLTQFQTWIEHEITGIPPLDVPVVTREKPEPR